MIELGRAKPVVVIGDSHTQIYDGRIYRDERSGDLLAMSVRYIPGITATRLLADKNNLTPEMFEALNRSGLITGSGAVRYLSQNPMEVMNDMAWGRPQTPPLLLLMIGDLNVKHQLSEAMAGGYDIVLPEGFCKYPVPGPEPERVPKILPFKLLLDELNGIFDPLFTFAGLLRGAGLKRLFLHSLPPPYAGDEMFRVMYKHAVPQRVRYKITLAVNALLERRCAEAGIGFVDIWPDVVDETGGMKPQFSLDGGHLHPDSCRFTVERLVAGLRLCQRDVSNMARFDTALARIAGPDAGLQSSAEAEAEDAIASWTAHGVARLPLPELPGLPVEAVDFADPEAAFEDIDWAFRPPADEAAAEWGRPTADFLDRLDGVLSQPAPQALMQHVLGGQTIVFSARPFRGNGNPLDLDGWARNSWPSGVQRGLIVLAGKTGPSFRTAEGPVALPPCPPGTLILYDPRRVACELPQEGGWLGIDLHLGPKVPEMEPRLIWNGRNCWPGDPFFFQLSHAATTPRRNRPYVALLAVPYWEGQPAISWDREKYWVLPEDHSKKMNE